MSVYCKKTKMTEGLLLNLFPLSNTAGRLGMATTRVAVLIYAEKEKLVSDAFTTIAWLFAGDIALFRIYDT